MLKKLYPTIEKVQIPFYKIYNHKIGETVIATEAENGDEPILIEDFIWFEKVPTTEDLLSETWASIENRSKQGLLKRAYTMDFEKHLPDGKVEIYIAVNPHC
ncbi:hypothetical protein A6B39_08875 [Mannheimia granulomatis]|uniref:hypothetical protein n=1 Tax=Mannheimia granulomatis TaxID=85402 RepID=UPI00159CFF93|nr:hypothetical protein [Mannheimia granulomatis]QLB15556.1 hypothetical protein A6B39_08875 [Mannheimia granulomatis]